MRILVLGAGGTGGYFGGRLVEAGADVTFLVRPKRAEALAVTGLRIVSGFGDATLAVRTVTADALRSPYDLVLLSCKAYDLDDAVRAVAPAVGPDTAVLPLLNGLAHLKRLDAAFGGERVLGGLCHIGVRVGPEGEIRHFNALHLLLFGERSGGASDRTRAIAAELGRARFASRCSPDVMQAMWEKLVFLATLAGMTCLMRASVGAIMVADEGEAITREFLAEMDAIATAHGHPQSPAAREAAVGFLTENGSGATASMLRDIEAGNRTEGDHVLGHMLRLAGAAGIAAPLLRVAVCHTQAYEAARAAGAGR